MPSDDPSMDVPFGAKVLRTDRERTCVAMNDGKEVWVQNKQVLKAMHISSRDGVNNMIMLGGEDIFRLKGFSLDTVRYFVDNKFLVNLLLKITFSRSTRICHSKELADSVQPKANLCEFPYNIEIFCGTMNDLRMLI